ncbi:MAG: hypothetical protein Q4C82_00190 [Eubacteriales bacterium]|nr:hypothetical protein [Eubacteriales bacterium]
MRFKKVKMLLCALSAAFLCSAFAAIPAEAATAFDYNYYYWKYPDVAVALGFDPGALFEHYENFGMAEGRYPNAQAEWRAAAGHVDTVEERTAFLMQIPPADPDNADSDLPKLDPIYYYNTYPDVAAVVGNNAQGLLEHYFAHGYSEGRLAFYGAEPCTEVQTSY